MDTKQKYDVHAVLTKANLIIVIESWVINSLTPSETSCSILVQQMSNAGLLSIALFWTTVIQDNALKVSPGNGSYFSPVSTYQLFSIWSYAATNELLNSGAKYIWYFPLRRSPRTLEKCLGRCQFGWPIALVIIWWVGRQGRAYFMTCIREKQMI